MRWLAAGLVVVLAGCGGGKATTNSGGGNTSLAQSRLTQAETRAAGFTKSGDYQNAARQYAEALRIATTLENADAIAANAINLSVVSQWLGRDDDARAALDAVLTDTHTAFSEHRKIQAELRRAIVELGGGNTGAAAVWAGQAQQRCNATSCEYAAGILNVRAQIELESGRNAEAAQLAQSAADRSRSTGSQVELANALRTLGRARHAQGQYAAAMEPLKQALEIDREMGDPRKILADLADLSRSADAAGDAAAARDYKERGLAVSRAMNGGRSAPEASLTR
ncbi:MAG: tetratricopeptide repeat protein [Betaproteobacteria bacterium]|nr:tetratricopeptide repeat protein [Betaproteobacteria bacterium]MBV9361027.1 tetratricopeptide repeat protein [Betaproteobacteria bacterium]